MCAKARDDFPCERPQRRVRARGATYITTATRVAARCRVAPRWSCGKAITPPPSRPRSFAVGADTYTSRATVIANVAPSLCDGEDVGDVGGVGAQQRHAQRRAPPPEATAAAAARLNIRSAFGHVQREQYLTPRKPPPPPPPQPAAVGAAPARRR